jgi:hypothetical protein
MKNILTSPLRRLVYVLFAVGTVVLTSLVLLFLRASLSTSVVVLLYLVPVVVSAGLWGRLAGIAASVASQSYNPTPDRVLRFARTDLWTVQVVVLGQDPYPQPGAATGRSFEVSGLKDWTTPFRQTSLRNILRAVYACYNGGDAPSWTRVRDKIADGDFPILPPDRLFDSLESQGVLFLNAYLTCRAGAPGTSTATSTPRSRW